MKRILYIKKDQFQLIIKKFKIAKIFYVDVDRKHSIHSVDT